NLITAGDEGVSENLSSVVKDDGSEDAAAGAVKGNESQATEGVLPPPISHIATKGGGISSAWYKSFDPIAFVERNLLMEGDST
ncbi:hypothetical protein A2U01_0088870, partial [Trifolium medium]|nr:hypothetical protein [Trifolium medium]